MDAYLHIPSEILGVLLESDLQTDEGAVQVNPIPTMLYLSALTWGNSDLAPTPCVLQTTGVEPTHKIMNLTDVDDDDVE